MSVLSRFTRKWFRRNQGRPTRLPQQMIKPGLENLEERTVPTVTFSYDGGAALNGNLSFISDNVNSSGNPDEFTLVESTGFGEWRFRSDPTPIAYGNTVLVADASTASVQGTPPPSINYAGFFDSVKLRPNLAANTVFNIDMNAFYSGLQGSGFIRNFSGSAAPANRLITINAGSGTFTFAGGIQDNGKNLGLTLNSAGVTQVLTATNPYSGATTVTAGTLRVNGTNANSPVTINGGTLSGTGTVNTVSLSGGNLSPGATTGILNTGNLAFTGGTFNAALASTSSYSQANVTGTVTLGSNTTLTLSPTFTPASGNTFTIINNDGSDAVSGTFKGLAEGGSVSISGVSYTISYKGGTGNDVVLTANPTSVSTTTTVATSASPSVFGQSVTFTATVVQGSGSTIPTGNVTFTNGATTLGTATLDAAGKATLSTSTLAVGGPYTITATYAGAGTFTGSFGTVSQTVNKASTTTTVTAAPNPSVYGQTVNFIASVSSTAGTAPTGTVDFYDGTTLLSSQPIIPGTIYGHAAFFNTSALGTGARSITAVYAGNTNFSTSTSSIFTQNVNKASTTTVVTSSSNRTVYGEPLTFTATVSIVAPGSGTSTGTVAFYDGATLLGTSPVSGGVATFNGSNLPAKNYRVTGVYSGDSNLNSSTSPNYNQTILSAFTQTTLTSNLNPVLFGQPVTFTAVVTADAPSLATPTGTVNFYENSALIGSSILNSAGAATFTTSSLSGGVQSITAIYFINNNFGGSVSPAVFQTVNQPPFFTNSATTTFQTEVPGSFQFTAGGYPTNFSFSTTGTLPAGVTLSPTGLLSGTPARGTGGVYNFSVTVSNGIAPDATQAFSLIVNQPPEFTNVNNAETFYGVPFNFTFNSSGYPTTFNYVVTAGALPSGLSLSSGGVLSGTVTPGVQGTYQFTVRSSNGVSPDAFQNFTLVVKPTGGLYNYNSATGELSISLADNVSLEMIESGGTTSFILSKPGENPFFVPATGSAVLTGNLTGQISASNIAGGLTINNDESRTPGTDNDLKFTSGNLFTQDIAIKIDRYAGIGSVEFMDGTNTFLPGDLTTYTNGKVLMNGYVNAFNASFNGGPGNPEILLTGPGTHFINLDFFTGGNITLGNSSSDWLDVTNGFLTSTPTSLGGSITTNNAYIELFQLSLNSESSIDTNNATGGNSVVIYGFTQNGNNLILDTGFFSTSFENDSTVDAQVLATTGTIFLGGLGSTVTFGNNSTVTSREGMIYLDGANYNSPAGNLASLIADDVKIDLAAQVGGSGSYLLAPSTVNEKTYLGTAANTLLPGLKLTQAEFDTFSTDVNYVQIGQNTYSGTIQTGVLNSANALYLVNNGGGGKVLVNGLLTVTGGDANNLGLYVIGSGSTTVLSANIVTAGVDVLIDDAVQVDNPSIRIDTTAAGAVPAGADVTLTGGTRGIFSTAGINNNLTVDGGTDGIVEFGYLKGFGNGATGSLLGSLTATGHGITLYNDNTFVGNLVLNSSYASLFGNSETYIGSIEIAGEVSLRNDVNLNAGSLIRLDSNLNGSGKNLSLGAVDGITAKGTIQGVNTLTLTNTGTASTFQAVSAQNLDILGSSASSSQVDFLGDMTVPGFVSTASGAYVVRLLGANNIIGGPLTTANDRLVIGNDDGDRTTITNDFNRALGTSLQGTIQAGGAISLDTVSPTTPSASLTVYGQTIDIGFDTGVGSEFQSATLSAVGDVNLNDGMLMVTDDLTIVGGSISQTFYSATKVSGLTYLYAYGDINLTAANDISLLEVYGNNVTLYTENGVEFDSALVSGNLNLYTDNFKGAKGNITQNVKGVQVYGNANFYSLGDIVLSNPLNVFTGKVTFSGNSVFLGGKSDINLGGGIANGDLTVNTSFANGDITQSGALSVLNGLTTLNAGAGSVVLPNVLNDLGDNGAVSITAENAYLTDVDELLLGTSTVTGDLEIFAQGAITQNGALIVANWMKVNSHNAVTLDNAGNSFGGTVAFTGDNVALTDSTSLAVAASSTTGTLALTSGGVLTQTGELTVGGNATLTATGSNILLTNTGNNFSGTLAFTGANVDIQSAFNLTLAASTATGTLNLVGLNLAQAGALTAGGNTTLSAADITLTNAGNSFGSTVAFSGANVSLTDGTPLAVAASTATGSLRLTSTGAISQTGALTAVGSATFSGTDITLNNAGNSFGGTVAFTGANVSLTDGTPLVVAASSATGTLALTSNGAITQTGALTAGGNATLTGTDITLQSANSFGGTVAFSGANVSLTDGTPLSLAASTATGNTVLISTGAVTQAGALTVGGTTQVTATGADITLTNAGNSLTGAVSFTGANVALTNTKATVLASSAATGTLVVDSSIANSDITQSGALSVAGLTTLNAGTGDVVLDNLLNSFGTGPVSVTAASVDLAASGALNLGTSTVTGSMDVFASGQVTQSGALNIGNWLDVRSYADVTLTDAGNTVGTLALEADSASFTEAGALVLGRVNVQQGDLTLTVGGNLTQTGPVQVVSPGATTTINAAGFDVHLPDLRNDLVLAVVNANNLVLADQNNVALENSTLAGDLEVSADATVTLLSVVSTGDATINAGQDIFGGDNTFGSGTANLHQFDAGRYIDFTNFGGPSQFNGSTYFNGTIVDVTATGDLILAAGNASILMSLVTDGSISQDKSQGYLNLSGNMILEALGDITLDAPGNVLVGNIAASATNITLLNTSQILLDTTTATGDLTLIAPAGVDQINPVTVGGKLDIQAATDSVTLTNAKNSLPTIALVADSANIVTQGAVTLLPTTAANFTLKTGGAVSQQGALTADVADIAAFSPITGPASITLDDATNRLRVLSLMGGTVVVNDTNYLDLGLVHANSLTVNIPGDLYQSNLLSISGPLAITAQDVSLPNADNTITGAITLNANSAMIVNSADINLANVAVTEGLALVTPGSISQTGSIKAGAYDLYAGEGASLNNLGGGSGANEWEGGLLTLTGLNNLSGGLTSHGTGVQLEGIVGGTLTVLSGSLSGNGKVGRIDNVKGTVSPTLAIPVANTLSAGTAVLQAGSALNLQLDSVVPGTYSQLLVTETILGGESALTIEGAQLNLNPGAKFFGLLGNQVTLIDNQGDNGISGTFNDLPEGAPLTLNGQNWVISYKGGDGNDVVITRQRYVPPATGPVVAQPFSLGAGSLVASLGNGKVGIWSDNGQYQEITPFPGYTGPLNVNTLTRSGNPKPDSIVVSVAGPSVPHVLVVDATTGRVALSFYAFDPKFLGGVTVAGGVTKLNGEQTTVILCGAGAGSAPAVSVFDAVDGYSKGAFYAFSEQYKGGVRVAMSSPLADGTSYVVVGSTINSHVVSFLLDDYNNAVSSFYAFPPANCPEGLYVAAADLDNNGTIEIITGAAKGKASPQVAVFSLMGQMKKAFNAFDMTFAGGVRVAANDMDADGDLDIMAASGPGAQGTLNAFNYQNLELIDSMFISDSVNGVVAGNNFLS